MNPLPDQGGSRTVLVVDDEVALRAITRLSLQREGFKVLEAATPDEALRLVAELHSRLDLLLTDVDLKGMGGHELADRLVAEHPGLRVLYCSGHDHGQLVRRGVLPSDALFLEKPFRVDGLARKVSEVLGESD
ncbi:MAG TPA: response regulator [Gemmataceae bacterium]|nr:response regulator [Gemmataceae bacterium]